MMRGVRRLLALTIAMLLVPAVAQAAPVTLAKLGDFSAPVYVTAPAGDLDRVFVVERGGTVKLVRNGAVSTFADLSARVLDDGDERGLLSIAFAPDYAKSGLFYAYYTAKGPVGAVTIEELRVDPANPDRADPSYARALLTIPHDKQKNHNGGQLQFAPDGSLLAGVGDGGGGGDATKNAQDTNTAAGPSVVTVGSFTFNHDWRLGKLLKIDRTTGAPSIFAYGLRNPWRFSFDRATGDLVIADVGEENYEEVDFAPAPGIGAGANYGWNTYEGRHVYPSGAPAGAAAGTVLPVLEYGHGPACSITGGYVVRDLGLPELAGTYVYGDFCVGDLLGANLPGGAPRSLGLKVPALAGFGEDGCGRVYAASLSGPVYRLSSTGACVPPNVAESGAPDRRAPAFTYLRAARLQHALRTGFVRLRARCDEQCALRASGRVTITRRGARASAARALVTRTAKATVVANTRTTLRLHLSRATRRAIARALHRPGRRATVRITLTAKDPAGNARKRTLRVRIVR